MPTELLPSLLEQGVTTFIAVASFLYIINRQQKLLDAIMAQQRRHTMLMYRLLRELGVSVPIEEGVEP